jgi:YebC/PmpR family DNA-binding regulatory protein
MSGHSKWSKIKHQKAAGDAKKGNLFSKIARLITVAAREGGDPSFNFKLRLAIDSAKAAGVPRENIERAVKRGTGEDKEGAAFEEVIYEGFGPGGAAIMIFAVTDNKNRAVSDIKHILSKYGGSLAGAGSVSWMFERKGVIRFEKTAISKPLDEFELELIEAGTQDIKEEDGIIAAYVSPADLEKVKKNLEEKGVVVSDAEVEYLAKDPLEIADPQAKASLEKMFEELDENEDVNDFYTNATI